MAFRRGRAARADLDSRRTALGRTDLVVLNSYDEGKIFVNERLIWNKDAAYSGLTIPKDKTVGVLWERGEERGYQFITFTRFNREFLEPAK